MRRSGALSASRRAASTACATVDLVRQLGGEVVGVTVLIELLALNGRAKLEGEHVRAVLQY
jgi:adenine phosphoribosyltransferase